MKFQKGIFYILMIMLLTAAAYSAVEIKGFVNDYANVISPDYELKIGQSMKRLYDSKTAEFAVVTVDSLEGQDIESYALNLAQGKLGDKEKNNGLLLLVSVGDRKYRFEVGRGIEPILNDAKIGRIGRNYLVDNLGGGEYGRGIYEASLAVNSVLLGETDSEYYVDESIPEKGQSRIGAFFSLFIFFMIISSVLGSFGRRNHTYRKRDRYFNAALMAGLLFGGRRGGFGGMGGMGGGGFGGGGAGSGF